MSCSSTKLSFMMLDGCMYTTKFVNIEISLIRCLWVVWVGIPHVHYNVFFSIFIGQHAKNSREEILTRRDFFSVTFLGKALFKIA